MAYPCPEPSQRFRELLHAIRQTQLILERCLWIEMNFYVSLKKRLGDSCEPTTLKSQQQKKLKKIDLSQDVSHAAVLNSEVQNFKANVKASFKETLSALDLFGNYLEAPDEETSEKFKELFNRQKSTENELLTIDETFDFLRSFLIDETEESQDSNYDSSEKHSVLKSSSSVNSLSQEASEIELVKRNLNSNEQQPQGRRKFTTTHNHHHDKSQEVLMNSSRQLVHVEQDCQNKNESENYENYQEKMKEMKDEIHLLRAENKEIMVELGQLTVEKTAKENERRNFELFHRIYRSSSAKASKLTAEDDTLGHPNSNDNTLQESPYVNKNPSTSKASGNGFTKPQATNENADLTSLVSKATSSKQNVQGAKSLVKENGHLAGEQEIVTHDEDEGNLHNGDENGAGISTDNNENNNLTTQNMPSIASKKKTSGAETIDQSGNVTGPSNEASTSREGNIEQSLTLQSYESLSFSVQQDYSNEQEKISLSNVPPTSVATTLYNNYKLLLLSLGQMLLSNDVTKLMAWATQNFPIVNPQNATHVLFQLDENEVINASDLSQLRHFFESIVRFDLVYVIDAFLLGDYGILRQITASKKRDVNTQQTSQTGTTTRYQNLFNAASNSQFSLRDSSLRGENSNEPQRAVLQQKQQAFPTLFLNNPTLSDAKFVPRSPNENHSTAYGLQSVKSGAMGFTASQVVVDGHVTNERRTTTGNSSTNANSPGTSNPRNTQTIGSNGSRLSTLRRNQEQSDNWLCSHYKRHCYVKFECCDQFWPCHRCHNNQSTCGRKKLKSRDTQMVKCVYCNKVQQFGEHCCDCGAKFASYYCGKCKHLTGTDDHPYHCEKCGICRIHGDRSFHCDICGVCLDVQLRGNHKCREGSAHDECCICLEDAFTGCQILPCSHKVHKECATQMIRSGITRCPICRESFAHKLERRPLPNSRKRGK